MRTPVYVIGVMDFLRAWPRHWLPRSRERSGSPTTSELRRWVDRRSVVINGTVVDQDHLVQWPVHSLVFFPRSRHRVTMIDEPAPAEVTQDA